MLFSDQDIRRLVSGIEGFNVVFHPRGGNEMTDRTANEALSFTNYVPKL